MARQSTPEDSAAMSAKTPRASSSRSFPFALSFLQFFSSLLSSEKHACSEIRRCFPPPPNTWLSSSVPAVGSTVSTRSREQGRGWRRGDISLDKSAPLSAEKAFSDSSPPPHDLCAHALLRERVSARLFPSQRSLLLFFAFFRLRSPEKAGEGARSRPLARPQVLFKVSDINPRERRAAPLARSLPPCRDLATKGSSSIKSLGGFSYYSAQSLYGGYLEGLLD